MNEYIVSVLGESVVTNETSIDFINYLNPPLKFLNGGKWKITLLECFASSEPKSSKSLVEDHGQKLHIFLDCISPQQYGSEGCQIPLLTTVTYKELFRGIYRPHCFVLLPLQDGGLTLQSLKWSLRPTFNNNFKLDRTELSSAAKIKMSMRLRFVYNQV